MSNKLPITYVMYLTTEGYGGSNTIYQATLDHTERQIPLSLFYHRVASLKVTPGRESVAEKIKFDLEKRGFKVITATAPWTRGISHFSEYLLDMRRVSQLSELRETPYILQVDHDYLVDCYREDPIRVLHKMTRVLESSYDVLSFRFLREEDQDDLAPDRTIETDVEQGIAWTRDYNFEINLLRSVDYYRINKVIEDNWSLAQNMHGEALWREVMAPMSRSPKKHAVWLKDRAVVANLGVPNYQEVAKRFNLTIAPNIE